MNPKYVFPYGKEDGRCHDCDVLPGEIHHEGCDVEMCPFTFGQRFVCGCGKCKNLKWDERVPFGFETEEARKLAL